MINFFRVKLSHVMRSLYLTNRVLSQVSIKSIQHYLMPSSDSTKKAAATLPCCSAESSDFNETKHVTLEEDSRSKSSRINSDGIAENVEKPEQEGTVPIIQLTFCGCNIHTCTCNFNCINPALCDCCPSV